MKRVPSAVKYKATSLSLFLKKNFFQGYPKEETTFLIGKVFKI